MDKSKFDNLSNTHIFATHIIHTFCENVFLQAVSHYVSDLSWRRFLLNLINPSLNDIVDEANRRTLKPSEIALDSEANWKLALLKTLSRQDTFNNIISEMLKAVTRIIGWSALMLVRFKHCLQEIFICFCYSNSSRDYIHFEMIEDGFMEKILYCRVVN